ncbi:hypothetical protein H1C71_012100, partial [Ictidomys tridecemlineatus]
SPWAGTQGSQNPPGDRLPPSGSQAPFSHPFPAHASEFVHPVPAHPDARGRPEHEEQEALSPGPQKRSTFISEETETQEDTHRQATGMHGASESASLTGRK